MCTQTIFNNNLIYSVFRYYGIVVNWHVQGFLKMVKEWSPSLYNVRAVVNATLEHILVLNSNEENIKPVLLEAVAILYSNVGQYDKALAMYLK